MKIEKAKIKDIDEIKQLYQVLFLDMANLQPEYFKAAKQDEKFLKMIIESDDSDILVAKNQKIIGLVLVQKQQTPPYSCLVEHSYTYLMDLVVDVDFRGQGIGKQLIESVKNWTLERNLEYIELNVLSENKKAINLYKKINFKEKMKTMRMKL